jgi:uncharacterized repeat protein (TIGR03803 family)
MVGQDCRKSLALAAVLAGLAMLPATRASAVDFQTLYTFTNGDDGAEPTGKLIYRKMVLYGTTSGANGGTGTIFSYDLGTQQFDTLYNFSGGDDGADPIDGVVFQKGVLYGTTSLGGASDYPAGYGTVYAFDLDSGELSPLHTFSGGGDGARPTGTLLLKKGTLYGTTPEGGVTEGCNNFGCGTVFSLAITSDDFNTLYQFPADASEGQNPTAGLTLKKGVLYGTTSTGGFVDGSLADGTVFALSGGTVDTQYTFSGQDGADPNGTMVYSKGKLYGTTAAGGSGGPSCSEGCGTIFSIDESTGELSILHNFTQTDGRTPRGGLLLHKGKLYGVTLGGGSGNCEVGCGTVYEFDLKSGTLTTLYNFSGGADGWNPSAGLILVKGTLYGTTALGGEGFGTVFSVTP